MQQSKFVKTLLLLLLCLLINPMIIAQELSGTVTDESSGEPIPGVNILKKGTQTGTVTDVNGNYEINVSPQDVLVFSYIGYINEEYTLNGETELDVTLSPDVFDLSEIVVIGYGTQKKVDLTSAISSVTSEELNKSGAPSLDNALQGRAAGVYVSQTSGMPGSSVDVKVRGIGSINRSSQPLYIIDGMQTSDLFSINPGDIESIQILKDASATAIYGSQASNGVVLIKTKQGKSGKPKLLFTMQRGISQVYKKLDMMNAEQYLDFQRKSYENASKLYGVPNADLPVAFTDSMYAVNGYPDTDWQDELSQTGQKENYDLSVRGGSETFTYMLSGGYYNEKGILKSSGVERFSLRANMDIKVNNWLTIGENLYMARVNTDQAPTYVWGQLTSSPIMPVYSDVNRGGYAGDEEPLTGRNDRPNPLAILMLNDDQNQKTKLLSSSFAEISFLKSFKYRINVGVDYNLDHLISWKPRYDLGTRSNTSAVLAERLDNDKSLIVDNLLTFEKTFANNHQLTVLYGHTEKRDYFRFMRAESKIFRDEDLNVLSQGETDGAVTGEIDEFRQASDFGRVLYNYKSKYLFQASVRRDGSSNFGPDNRWGVFPAFSAAWKINEDLLPAVKAINLLKLRASWGQTGNQDIPPFAYAALLNPPTDFRYAFGPNRPQSSEWGMDDQNTYLGQAPFESFGNKSIKWESAEMLNFGIDLTAFANKLEFSAEYYIKNQNDLLVQVLLPGIYGLGMDDIDQDISSASPWANLGQTRNKGVDVFIKYRNMDGVFKYSVNASLTTIKNEVISLPFNSYFKNDHVTQVGNTIGSFYGYIAEGIFQDSLEVANSPYQRSLTAPGDIKFKDLNEDRIINQNDMTIIGKPIPDFTYGFGLDLYYKNFDFNAFAYGMQNMDVYNRMRIGIGMATDQNNKDENKLVEAGDFWTPENPSTTMTRANIVDYNQNQRISTWWIEDASFLRIKTMQIGYTLPESLVNKILLSTLRLYFSVNNLYTFTKYRGYDPEVGDKDVLNAGVDSGHYPVPRSFLFGLQVDF